jgi:hypothetical protein
MKLFVYIYSSMYRYSCMKLFVYIYSSMYRYSCMKLFVRRTQSFIKVEGININPKRK